MSLPPPLFWRGFGALLPLALGLVTAPAVAADRLSMRVEVYGPLGLHVLTLNTILEEIGDHYAITADYATTAVAGLIIDQKTHAQARGRLTPAPAQPESFRSLTRRNGVERQDSADYRPDGSVDGRSITATSDTVSAGDARGTVGNLNTDSRLGA